MSNDTARPTPGIIDRLLAFDTATLFEASPGDGCSAMTEIRTVAAGQRIAGPALTAACPGGDNLMLHAAVADARPGEVLVVQCHDASYGVWGEVLMTAAMARGVAALVIDGSVRDIEAMRAAGFPVFSRSLAIRGAQKNRPGLLRQPISCGGILVWPGDMIVADDTGVIAIRPDAVGTVLDRARQRQDKEAAMMEKLKAGRTTVELLGLDGALKPVAGR